MCGYARFETLREHHAFEAGCLGKDKYPSESAADAVLEHSKRGLLYEHSCSQNWTVMDAYHCAFCGSWHIGHRS